MSERIYVNTSKRRIEDVVVGWLTADPVLLVIARDLANGDEFEFGDNDLVDWVVTLLWDAAYGSKHINLADLEFVREPGGDVELARRVRASLDNDMIYEADWAQIRTRLLADTENGA